MSFSHHALCKVLTHGNSSADHFVEPALFASYNLSSCSILDQEVEERRVPVMAMRASPSSERARSTRKRLENCWDLDLDWNKYPTILREVSTIETV